MKNKINKVVSILLSFLTVASIIPIGLLNVQALDGRVEKAIEWAISIANDNSHGYNNDVNNRNGPDYDCSSFVSTAFKNGGFSVSGSLNTTNMLNAFITVGFTKYNKGAVTLQRGDILLKPGSHVELYIGNNQYVTAHQNYDGKTGDSDGKEILVHNKSFCNFSKNDEYTYILRYEGANQNNGTSTDPYSSTNPDSYTYPTRTLKQTTPIMSGSDVAWVQAVLKKLGYNITIDGKYGPNTASIVKQFQSAYGLTVDGYCGPKTREKLLSLWNAMKHPTHNYVWKQTVSATCTQTGKNVYQCSCGASYTETIAALGHSFPTQWVVDQVATCTQCGKEHRTCTRCGTIEYATLPYKQHTESDWITDKEATCTQDGSKHKECTSCGKILETGTITSILGHRYYLNEWTIDKPATCTQEGSKSRHCAKCGAKFNVTVIPAKGHKSSSWIIDKTATVNAAGSQHKECTVCGEVLETAVIPQLKPATPKLTKVVNTASGAQITWSASEGADNYIVYRRSYNATTKQWSGWSKLKEGVTSTYYLDETVKSGTYYRYTVRATNEGGISGFNTSGLKTYFLSTPKATTANSNSGVTVKWGKVTGATGYIVYRKTGNGKWQNLGKTTGTTFTDKTAKAGVTYRYTVKAYYSSYVSAYNTNGYAVRRLLTPTLKSVTSAKVGVTFKWNKVTGATGYTIYRKTGNGGWVKLATVTGNSTVSYLDKTAKKGVTYTYTVRAYYGTSTSYYNTKGLTIKDKY